MSSSGKSRCPVFVCLELIVVTGIEPILTKRSVSGAQSVSVCVKSVIASRCSNFPPIRQSFAGVDDGKTRKTLSVTMPGIYRTVSVFVCSAGSCVMPSKYVGRKFADSIGIVSILFLLQKFIDNTGSCAPVSIIPWKRITLPSPC